MELARRQRVEVEALGLDVKVAGVGAADEVAEEGEETLDQLPLLADHHRPHQTQRLVDGAVQIAELSPQRVVRVGLFQDAGPVGPLLPKRGVEPFFFCLFKLLINETIK